MVPDTPEPHLIHDGAALAVALAAVKGPRSYRTITADADALTPSGARLASGIPDWTPEALSRGTVSDWVAGRGTPTRTKLLTFLVVCDIAAELVPGWLAALDRVRAGRRPEPSPPVAPPRRAGRPRPRGRLAATVAAVTVVLAGVGVVIARGVPTAGDPNAALPRTSTAQPARCGVVADGRAVVQPHVTGAGVASGLTFCPVRINDGRLPITGPFALAGQVLGPVAQRSGLLLVNRGDPRTCDALGNPAVAGSFLADQADLAAPDGRWSTVDALGYAEAVTLGRKYRHVSASPSSLTAIKGDARAWMAAHPADPNDYPGILALPADAQVLATFDIPPGTYPGAKPCGRG